MFLLNKNETINPLCTYGTDIPMHSFATLYSTVLFSRRHHTSTPFGKFSPQITRMYSEKNIFKLISKYFMYLDFRP
jgi:hypothetical protein